MDKAIPGNPRQASIPPAQDNRTPSNPSSVSEAGASTAGAATATTAATAATTATAAEKRRNPAPQVRSLQLPEPKKIETWQIFPPSPFADNSNAAAPDIFRSPFAEPDLEASADGASASDSSSGTPLPRASASKKSGVPKLNLSSLNSSPSTPASPVLAPGFGPQAQSMWVSSPRNRGGGKASSRPVLSPRGLGSGGEAQRFPGGFATHRRASQSAAQPQPTSVSRADTDAGRALQDDGKARIDILIGAERKALTQGKKGQGGEMTEGHVRAFFRTDKPVVWKGQTLNAFKLVTEFVKPRLEECEIGRVLQKSKNKVLKDEVLKKLAQDYFLDRTKSILFVTLDNGKPSGNYALFKPYIDPILKSLRPKDNAPATSCLPAEVRKFLLDMDAEIVKLCLESKALDTHAINQARTNAIISILFTRGLGPQIDIAAAQENSWERTLLTAFSTCLNSKINFDSKRFLFSIITEATKALPGDLRTQLSHRRAATVANSTRFRGRGARTGGREFEAETEQLSPRGRGFGLPSKDGAGRTVKRAMIKEFLDKIGQEDIALLPDFKEELKESLNSLDGKNLTIDVLYKQFIQFGAGYISRFQQPESLETAKSGDAQRTQLKKLQEKLQPPSVLDEQFRFSSEELEELESMLSQTLALDDVPAENDGQAFPLAPEKKENEKN
ncbi:MAG: hypothetical protein ACO1N5_07670 [Noviherbaspirillum sp.]